MEKVKHYSQYSDRQIKNYAEFVKLAGFIDFQILLWHRVPVGKGYPSRKERFIIESFYYDTKPESNPKYTQELFETFKFLQSEIETIKFYEKIKEKEFVAFVKEIKAKKYLDKLSKNFDTVNELTEKEAALIISCTFYEWVATGKYKQVNKNEKEMIYSHRFYDLKNGAIKKDIQRKTLFKIEDNRQTSK